MNYKDTLLMPQTDFEMRGKLPTKEPVIQAKWKEIELYQQVVAANKGNEQFILHDGPPYANGDIHMGHGLNKVIKDIIVRSKNLQGYWAPYTPGWDTHGLPIETAITKSGVDRKKLTVAEFRQLCEDFAYKQIANQSQQFQRLGSFGDYDNPYLTLNKSYEAIQIQVFAKMALDGLIYRGLKPVYWSPSSETALAEAEIEYHDKEDNSVYLKFRVVDGNGLLDEDTSFICWTTMPWTVVGTIGVSLHENIEYGLYETNAGKYVLAEDLAEDAFGKMGLEYKLVKEFIGSELEHTTSLNPLTDYLCPTVLGDHVTTEGGTGCVTTAPGHGNEDFMVGQKYDLGLVVACDERGIMAEVAGPRIAGMFYEKANDEIIKIVEEKDNLLLKLKIKHSYPHDWRTKKPIIFMATKQWFASIEKKRAELLEQIELVNWVPVWGQIRMHNMISDRGDWCISRQRSWGVPIPIIYDENKEPLLDSNIFEYVSDKFLEHGSNYWFEAEVKDLLPASYQNRENLSQYTKETDTMDVWFDSGSSHTAGVMVEGSQYPFELYLEGSDQYRGFFNSSLIIGTCIHNQSPYKQVLSHGFTLDIHDEKMSKSLGNTIEPLKVINQYGADVFRYWVSSVDYQSDIRVSEDAMRQVSDAYRKVRNTFKFMLGNLRGFDESMVVEFEDLAEVDQYILIKLNKLLERCTNAYNSYDFNVVYSHVNNFIIKELSAFYMDFTKDILYILKEDDHRRVQVQTVLYECLNTLNIILAPILPHTTDEVYGFIPKANRKVSVHLERIPKARQLDIDHIVEDKYNLFMKHREDILKAIENAREKKIIGKSLEASIQVFYKEGYEFIKDIPELHQLYIASNVEVLDAPSGTEMDTAHVEITKFEGYTCPRCWNIVSSNRVVADLCDRCDAVVNK